MILPEHIITTYILLLFATVLFERAWNEIHAIEINK